MRRRGAADVGLKSAVRSNVVARLPAQLRLPIERFYDYYCAGDYVRSEVRLIRGLCAPRRASIDVGANRGQLTPFILKYSSHVHCIEPVPELCERLEARFRGCAVSVVNCALGNVNGVLSLNIPRVGSRRIDTRSSLVKTFDGEQILGMAVSGVDHVEVPVRRLDDLGLRDIGFIKIDVEGYETEVLAGASETIVRERPNLLVEIEQRHCSEDVRDVFARIRAMGYRGEFLFEGKVRSIEQFDVRVMQDAANERTPRYVNNFAFRRAS
jgi:FkbM family methyltransferase